MEDYIEQFIEARDYLESMVREKMDIYMCDIWNPMCRYVLIKETNKLINQELVQLYPKIPSMYLPKCKIRTYSQVRDGIEIGLQQYFNANDKLIFLGNRMINETGYDLYCKKTYDPNFEYEFVSKYGHGPQEYFLGDREAASDYMLGKVTPLYLAYELAIEEGFVK